MEFYAFHAPTPDLFELENLRVKVKVPASVKLEAVFLRSEADNEERLTPMELTAKDKVWQIWQASLKLDTADEVTRYCFKFLSGQQYWLSEAGISHYFPERDVHYRFNPHYKAADWVWSQVFYQIFPERFCDGDPSNNVREGEYLYQGNPVVAKTWGELPERKQGPREFYGGDLEGVRQRLDYLQDLGVTALYLNPIFTSPSSHKYDTVDYDHVDPHFGGDEAFAKLCEALRQRRMRLILDAVVNHTSERHPWFDRYGEYETPGAYQSKDSPTRAFYIFENEDPESYVGWYDVKTLPVLDFSSKALQGRIYRDEDAMLRKWMRPPYSIDGWRFDVIHMLGEGHGAKNNHHYARSFRQTLREENPASYMLGEHFFEASKWLQGDQEDGAMNYYGFTRPLREFLSGHDFRGHPVTIDAKDLDAMWQRARARIPFALQLSQFNLLGSHDVPRMLTVLSGDKALYRLAITALFTYIGVPCVYYGDEVGLEGGEDPDCRRTFPWDEAVWDFDLRQHYQKLIALRKNSKVLQQGAFLSLYAEGNVYAYARVLGDDSLITVLNRGEATQVDLPLWKLGGTPQPLTLAAKTSQVLGLDASGQIRSLDEA